MARILLTGATGFIGRHAAAALQARQHDVVGTLRCGNATENMIVVGDIGPRTEWSVALKGVDTVIHLAGVAHRAELRQGGDSAFRRVNDEGTGRLVESARSAGVRLFIQMSSVYAREYEAGHAQGSRYGETKLAAERHALGFASSGRAAVVLRPPLVYGVNARANWAALMRLAALPVPLPFGAIANKRSLVSVGNLVDAVTTIVEAGSPQVGVFEIADGPPVSLRDVLAWLRRGMGRAPGFVSVPAGVFRALGNMTGLSRTVESLIGDLVVDPQHFMKAFQWTVPESSADAISRCGSAYAADEMSA